MITKVDSNEEYHSSEGISASGLKTIYAEDVNEYLNGTFNETPAMRLGTAVHAAILEPKAFKEEYYTLPKIDRRTKEGKALYQEHLEKSEGKILTSLEERQIIDGILANFNKHELAKKYCTGDIEVSHYGEYDDVKIRVRPDCKNASLGFISDVKTCQKSTKEAFLRDVRSRNYHLQAAFYSDMLGFPAENFRFIAASTNPPFSVHVYALPEYLIDEGRERYKLALERWKMYLATGETASTVGHELAEDGAILLTKTKTKTNESK